jgi:hypothetical protein
VVSSVASKANVTNPRVLLHGRPDELLCLVIIVSLLEEDVSLRDHALAKIRSFGRGDRAGGGLESYRHL